MCCRRTIDDMVVVENGELRHAWRRADGMQPESVLASNLSGFELAINLPANKTKQGQIVHLGWIHDGSFCSNKA